MTSYVRGVGLAGMAAGGVHCDPSGGTECPHATERRGSGECNSDIRNPSFVDAIGKYRSLKRGCLWLLQIVAKTSCSTRSRVSFVIYVGKGAYVFYSPGGRLFYASSARKRQLLLLVRIDVICPLFSLSGLLDSPHPFMLGW